MGEVREKGREARRGARAMKAEGTQVKREHPTSNVQLPTLNEKIRMEKDWEQKEAEGPEKREASNAQALTRGHQTPNIEQERENMGCDCEGGGVGIDGGDAAGASDRITFAGCEDCVRNECRPGRYLAATW